MEKNTVAINFKKPEGWTRKIKKPKKGSMINIITYLTRYTPFIISAPILIVTNILCYELNNRMLNPATNLIWIGITTMVYIKHYRNNP